MYNSEIFTIQDQEKQKKSKKGYLKIDKAVVNKQNNRFSDPMFLFDEDGKLLNFNDAVCRLTGYSYSELSRMTVADLLSMEFERELRLLQENPEQQKIEHNTRIKFKNGLNNPCAVEISRVKGSTYIGYCKSVSDTSALNGREDLQSGLYRINNQNNTLKSGLEQILELYMHVCHYGRGFIATFDFYDSKIRTTWIKGDGQDNKALLDEQLNEISDYLMRRPESRPVWTDKIDNESKSGSFFRDHYELLIPVANDQFLFGIIGLAEKKSEAETDRNSDLFNTGDSLKKCWLGLYQTVMIPFRQKPVVPMNIFQSPMLLTDINGKILDINQPCRKVMGDSDKDMSGKLLFDLLEDCSADDTMAALRKLQKNETYTFQAGLSGPEKRDKYIRFSVTRCCDSTEYTHYLFRVEDLPASVSGDFGLQQDINTLYQRQRLEELGSLAGGVAHEINNPITGIINYAQLILQRSTEDSLQRYAGEIIEEGHRIGKLVQNLLLFARQNSQETQIASPLEIVESSVSLIKTTFRKENINIEIAPCDTIPSIICNPQKIKQVLINLLTNAQKALNQKYPEQKYNENKKIIISLATIDDDGQKWLRITVKDFGIGIPKQTGDKIFQPFYTTYLHDGGSGLGLALCRSIIGEHEGRLSYQSEYNRYTQFYLDLPLESKASDKK